MTQDDETPLADWPDKKEPKAGDPDVNRARDAKHYAGNHPGFVLDQSKPVARDVVDVQSRDDVTVMTAVPQDAPIMIAWNAFKKTESFANSKRWTKHNPDEHLDGAFWAMFMAGWSARDSQP